MIRLILMIFIQTLTFGQVASIFVNTPEEELELYLQATSIENLTEVDGLFSAIRQGDTYKVKEGLGKGIHPDVRSIYDISNGMTTLMESTSHRRYFTTKILLNAGADPNLTSYSLGVSNITPLMIAAQQGPLEIVQILVSNGALINTQTTGVNSGNTALMAAIKNRRLDIVTFLMSHGADPNLATTSGEITNITPLMLAAQTGDIEIIRQVIQSKDVNMWAKDSLGRNILVYAYMSGNIELINYLGSIGLETDLSPEEVQKTTKNFL